jgi:hypothetical protein
MRQRSAGSWELRVYVGLDPDTGRRRYRTKTVRGNGADAERELVDFVDRVGQSRSVGGRVMVGELLDRWFALASLSWAPTTVRQTHSIVNRHLRPHIGRVAVGDLTTADIDALYAKLLAGPDGAGWLSGGTVQRVHVVLRSALAQAMRWVMDLGQPAAHAAKIVAPNREPDPPAVDELVALLDHLESRNRPDVITSSRLRCSNAVCPWPPCPAVSTTVELIGGPVRPAPGCRTVRDPWRT